VGLAVPHVGRNHRHTGVGASLRTKSSCKICVQNLKKNVFFVGSSPLLHRFVLSFHDRPCHITGAPEVYLRVVALAVPHFGRNHRRCVTRCESREQIEKKIVVIVYVVLREEWNFACVEQYHDFCRIYWVVDLFSYKPAPCTVGRNCRGDYSVWWIE
jgi:hypothetical protein